MAYVNVRCSSCDALIGCITNMWASIGSRCITPLNPPENCRSLVVHCSGNLRSGQSNTVLEDCQIQNIDCITCKRRIGVQCVCVPSKNHVLRKNQMVFNSKAVTLTSNTPPRQKLAPIIDRDLNHKSEDHSRYGGPKISTGESFPRFESLDPQGFEAFTESGPFWNRPRAATRDQNSSYLANLHGEMADQKALMQQMMDEGRRVVVQLESSLARVNEKARCLERELLQVRKEDEDRRREIQVLRHELAAEEQGTIALKDLQQSMARTKSDVAELRNELFTTQRELRSAVKENRELRKDYNSLKAEDNNDRAGAEDYASEVSGLRKEMRQLKADLAEQRKSSARRKMREDSSLSLLDSSAQRKRAIDETEDLDRTPKRRAMSSGYQCARLDDCASVSQQSTPSNDRTLRHQPASPIPLTMSSGEGLLDVSPSKSIRSSYTEDGDEMVLVQCP